MYRSLFPQPTNLNLPSQAPHHSISLLLHIAFSANAANAASCRAVRILKAPVPGSRLPRLLAARPAGERSAVHPERSWCLRGGELGFKRMGMRRERWDFVANRLSLAILGSW
jgi:hypothetical protein